VEINPDTGNRQPLHFVNGVSSLGVMHLPKHHQKGREAEAVRVLLVETHPLVAAYLRQVLQTSCSLRVITYNEIIAPWDPGKMSPCVVVIDTGFLNMPLDLYLGAVKARFVDARVLAIGRIIINEELCRLIILGICGIVPYEDVGASLGAAIRTVSEGRFWLPAGLLEEFALYAAKLFQPKGSQHNFTPREKSVLNLIQRRLTNKEIASELDISERTVKFHLDNIFDKSGIHDRSSVAKFMVTHNAGEIIAAKHDSVVPRQAGAPSPPPLAVTLPKSFRRSDCSSSSDFK
jgi:two-component system nitrate/nitrite response regulator NarL